MTMAEGIMLGVLVVVVLGMAALIFARKAAPRTIGELRDDFRRHREMLEAKFFQHASQRGIPRGLAWVRCDFADDITFARDRNNQEVCVLVAVTIGFEAVEGGGMEEVEAVGNLRAATAVFRHRNGQWLADGRVVFNLSPEQTIAHFGHELESVPPM